MFRLIALLAALTVGSAAFAQSAPSHHKAKKKAAPVTDQTPTDPNDVSAVPENVQKWVGSTMDDVLTGTGKIIDDVGKN